jgi:hypothetical protein
VDQSEHEIEETLRRSRPAPAPEWRSRAEAELFPPRRSIQLWRWPVARAGAGLAMGLAAVVLVLALVGVTPLGGRDHDVRARDRCPLVTVVKGERVPRLVVDPDQGVRVTYRVQPVRRTVRRCPQR